MRASRWAGRGSIQYPAIGGSGTDIDRSFPANAGLLCRRCRRGRAGIAGAGTKMRNPPTQRVLTLPLGEGSTFDCGISAASNGVRNEPAPRQRIHSDQHSRSRLFVLQMRHVLQVRPVHLLWVCRLPLRWEIILGEVCIAGAATPRPSPSRYPNSRGWPLLRFSSATGMRGSIQRHQNMAGND